MHDKRRDLIRALLAAPCGFVASWAAPVARAAPRLPAVGSPLELPDLPLIEGGTFQAAEAKGRVVMVYWWASWCPFCAEMSPHVEKLWRDQRERGLVVLGIAIDRSAEAPLQYRRRRGFTFPSTLYEARLESVLARPRSVPVTWVRDRKGLVVMTETGQMFPEDVAEIARFL
jgi:thiol-disulfide isomerase/thioredoxin